MTQAAERVFRRAQGRFLICSIMGYASTVVSGLGIALVKEHFGWDVTLAAVAGCALVGMVLFAFAWNATADGYGRPHRSGGHHGGDRGGDDRSIRRVMRHPPRSR